MMRRIEIVPAVMPKDLAELQEQVMPLGEFAESVHVDIMDGIFVPEISWPYVAKGVPNAVGKIDTTLTLEAHLMVAAPGTIVSDLIHVGFTRIIVHPEKFVNARVLHDTLAQWRASGVEVGLAFTAHASSAYIRPLEPSCDFFQVMTIGSIGRQGIPFESALLGHVSILREWFPHKIIAVDGGINETTIAAASQAGANRVIVGSAITQSANKAGSYQQLQKIANSAV